MRTVLDEAPGVFAPVADHPATEQALVTAYRELRAVPDTALDAVAACSVRASDVVRIHRAVRERLSSAWHDEEDLLLAAAGALRSGAAAEIGPVVVHLLPDLTTGEADLVATLATRGRLLVNIGLTGDPDADGPCSRRMRGRTSPLRRSTPSSRRARPRSSAPAIPTTRSAPLCGW